MLDCDHSFLESCMPLLIFPYLRSGGGKILNESVHGIVIPLKVSITCVRDLCCNSQLCYAIFHCPCLVTNVWDLLDHDVRGPASWSPVAEVIKTSLHTKGWALPLMSTLSVKVLYPAGRRPVVTLMVYRDSSYVGRIDDF